MHVQDDCQQNMYTGSAEAIPSEDIQAQWLLIEQYCGILNLSG